MGQSVFLTEVRTQAEGVFESRALTKLHNVEHHDLHFRDEMGGTCGTNEAAARFGVSWQDLKARDGLDGRMILK